MGSQDVTEVMFESRPERNEGQATGLTGGEERGGSGSGRETSRHLGKGLAKSGLFIDFFPFLSDIHVGPSIYRDALPKVSMWYLGEKIWAEGEPYVS